jgi:glycosyltransferase involved in cell wall biosynthesis
MPRTEALLELARRLEVDPDASRGRPASLDDHVRAAVAARDARALDAILDRYTHDVPDPDAPARLRRLAESDRPIVGYLGKLIPQKGVELLIQTLAAGRHDVHGLIVGFGSDRERLAALTFALQRGDVAGLAWLHEVGVPIEPATLEDRTPRVLDVTFTGMLDHRYAPGAVAACDVSVVPSILGEAFGMVAVEAAAAGALPLVARHTGLAEVAATLEADVGHPGVLSFEPGPGAVDRLSAAIDRLLSLPAEERTELRDAVSASVRTRWTWERTAAGLLKAASASSRDSLGRRPGHLRRGR